MNQLDTTFKGCKIRNHRIPVVFGEGCCFFTAMLNEITSVKQKFKTSFGTNPCFNRLFFCVRQNLKELFLGILAFGMIRETFHHNGVFLTVIETGQTHNTALINAHRVAVKMSHELFLHKAELFNLCVTHQPVNVQRFAGLNNHRGRQRKLIDCFLLFLEGEVIHLNELCVDTADATILLATIVDNEKNATVLFVM